jgi:hypothetical protein
MSTIRLRLTGSVDHAHELINRLSGIEGIEPVEEVADEMPHMDDEDSSSAGLPDDMGPGIHNIEVHAGNDRTAERVRDAAEEAARRMEATLELVDEF